MPRRRTATAPEPGPPGTAAPTQVGALGDIPVLEPPGGAERWSDWFVRHFPAMRSPTYRRFFVGALLANVGGWMQTTAQGWLVLSLTGSPALLGLTSAAALFPSLVLSLVAGVLADRLDRRRLLVTMQLTAAALAICLALLVTTGVVAFWHIVLLALLAGSASAIATPSFQAIVPALVSRDAIGNAIALNAAQFNLSRIVGPMLAGAAIAAGLLVASFWINAAALLLVAVILARLRLPRGADIARTEASLWSNLVDGLAYVRARPTVAALLLLAAVPALLALNYLVLLPVYARDVLAAGPTGLGIMTAAVGLGALSGALAVAALRPAGGSGRLMLLGLGGMSAAVVLFGLSTWLPLSLVALALVGAAQTTYYSTANTLLQVLVPGRLRGRVLSLWILVALGLIPVGNVLAGLVAERLGPSIAVAGGGSLAVILVVVVWIGVPSLRHLRADDAVEADEPEAAEAVGGSAA